MAKLRFIDFLKRKIHIEDKEKIPEQQLPVQEEIEPQYDKIEPKDENKDRLTRKFRIWLDSFDLEAVESVSFEEKQAETDLYNLFSEFIALKNEVQRQSRQFKSSLEQTGEVITLLQSASEALKEEKALRKEDNRQIALRMILVEFLDIRDRAEEGLRILKRRKPSFWKRLFRIKDGLVESIIEGQGMLLGRMDRMLLSHGVMPIETEDKIFDPNIMRVVEIDNIAEKQDGLVLEEIRKGFKINNEIIRVAEVKVNKCVT